MPTHSSEYKGCLFFNSVRFFFAGEPIATIQAIMIRKPQKQPAILMLLTNAYDPDPRVRQEALSLITMGCKVHLLAWDRDGKAPASERMEGVEVERLYLPSKHGRGNTQILFYLAVYIQMLWRGLRTPFDVVHCHDLDTLPLGFLLSKLKRKPVVYDAHESFPDMLTGSVHPTLRRALFRIEDYFIARIDLLITVGDKLRSHFAERGARNAVVVGNWKLLPEFDRTPEQNALTRRSLNIPQEALAVVCITNLLAERKLEQLLEAVDKSPDVYAVIGGDGALRPVVERHAANNPRIVYVGFVRGSAIADYTSACDVVYYGFDERNPNARFSAPNKLFEALAAGVPLITGNFGEIADIVRRFSCGIVLPEYTADSVRNAFAALQNPLTRSTMAHNAWHAGQLSMNWRNAEEVLYRSYSRVLSTPLKMPESLQLGCRGPYTAARTPANG